MMREPYYDTYHVKSCKGTQASYAKLNDMDECLMSIYFFLFCIFKKFNGGVPFTRMYV